jgi:hypothetical protein
MDLYRFYFGVTIIIFLYSIESINYYVSTGLLGEAGSAENPYAAQCCGPESFLIL